MPVKTTTVTTETSPEFDAQRALSVTMVKTVIRRLSNIDSTNLDISGALAVIPSLFNTRFGGKLLLNFNSELELALGSCSALPTHSQLRRLVHELRAAISVPVEPVFNDRPMPEGHWSLGNNS